MMLPYRYFSRLQLVALQSAHIRILSSVRHLCSSKDKNSAADGKLDTKSSENKKEETAKRLNLLLKAMVDEKELSSSTKALNTELAKPRQKELQKKLLINETRDPKEALIFAAKQVAESFGGDVKQTESELLSKVTVQSSETKKKVAGGAKDSSSSSDSSSSGESSSSSDEEDGPEKKEAPAPQFPPKKLNPTKATINLSELIIGMKIDRTKRTEPEGRASQVRKILGSRQGGEESPWRDRVAHDRRSEGVRDTEEEDVWEGRGRRADGYRQEDSRSRLTDGRRHGAPRGKYSEEHQPRTPPMKVDLFGHEALGIFAQRKTDSPSSEVKTTTTRPGQTDFLTTWRALHERELRLTVTHPPSNYFEEMILWTDQGKLWKFPIDNEQGLDEERKVCFTEHVFLERHLEPWCPKRGPVRHFMELVCVGLSKNPYISAQEKRSHLDWFRDYFKQKEDILRETGALADKDSRPPAISAQ